LLADDLAAAAGDDRLLGLVVVDLIEAIDLGLERHAREILFVECTELVDRGGSLVADPLLADRGDVWGVGSGARGPLRRLAIDDGDPSWPIGDDDWSSAGPRPARSRR
jgi:hypothetical protein